MYVYSLSPDTKTLHLYGDITIVNEGCKTSVLLIIPHLLKDKMFKYGITQTVLKGDLKMISCQYVDRFLTVILYRWISNIYKRYENSRNLQRKCHYGHNRYYSYRNNLPVCFS